SLKDFNELYPRHTSYELQYLVALATARSYDFEKYRDGRFPVRTEIDRNGKLKRRRISIEHQRWILSGSSVDAIPNDIRAKEHCASYYPPYCNSEGIKHPFRLDFSWLDAGLESITIIPEQKCFKLLFGHPLYGAIFMCGKDDDLVRQKKNIRADIDGIKLLCAEKWLRPDTMASLMARDMAINCPDTFQALTAFSAAALVYENLPEATVAIECLNKSILKTKWAAALKFVVLTLRVEKADAGSDARYAEAIFDEITRGFNGNSKDQNRLSPIPSRGVTFACMAYFESGHCDIDCEILSDVFALCVGDSIYAVSELFNDPYRRCQAHTLKHIIGNVGRPGITLLVPPGDPMVREVDPGAWKRADYKPFDGVAQDSFSKTSLHLSFTEGYTPLHDGVNGWGRQNNQAFMLESVVSVFDNGNWVADIDISRTYRSLMICLMRRSGAVRIDCAHQQGGLTLGPDTSLTSLDSWDEVLDLPRGDVIIRAKGNWSARLALLCVLAHRLPTPFNATDVSERSRSDFSRKMTIIICPKEVCWSCICGHMNSHSLYQRIFLQ
ncbi:hypothetical protein F5Y19DRAFT_485897, partial [Xylariaceae sp. FL1651]